MDAQQLKEMLESKSVSIDFMSGTVAYGSSRGQISNDLQPDTVACNSTRGEIGWY